jgi:hypothetical protein
MGRGLPALLAAALALLGLGAGTAAASDTPPTVVITSPPPGTVHGTVRLDVSAADDVGVTAVEYLVDGAPVASDTTCCAWDELWNTTRTANGVHTLTARAHDAAGNEGESAPVVLSVQNPPENEPESDPPPDPFTCEGYPEPRIFLESQSWWSPAADVPLGARSEHAHSAACFPYDQVVSGQLTLHVVSTLHGVPGWFLRFVRVQAASDQDGVRTLRRVDFGATRPCLEHDCRFVTRVVVDTDQLPAGRWEFRIHTEIRPAVAASTANLATNGWQACVRTCDGRTPKATDVPEGRGWYRTAERSVKGYVNARFDSAELPWNPATGEFTAVSGTWCPQVRILRGAGDEPVTNSFASVDPAFHAATPELPEGDPGVVQLAQPGPFQGLLCIDTTRLSNGRHRLFLRADWNGGPLAGALVVPFEVQN